MDSEYKEILNKIENLVTINTSQLYKTETESTNFWFKEANEKINTLISNQGKIEMI